MGRRGSWVSALLIMVLGVTAAPVTAAERAGQQDVAGRTTTTVRQVAHDVAEALPPGAHVLTVDDSERRRNDTVTDVAVSMRHYHDTAAWLATVQKLIEHTTGTPAAALAAGERPHGTARAGDDDDQTTAEEDPDTPDAVTGTALAGLPAGDLDGDGADDIVMLNIDVATGDVVAQARRGRDSAVLWERQTAADGALVWPLGEDVDGDGIDDLSLYNLHIHDEHIVEECETYDEDEWCWPTEYHATFTWTLGVTSGSDGAPLWTRDFGGHVDEVYGWTYESDVASSEYSERYELASDNLYVIDLFAGDTTGAGVDELIIDAIDLDVVAAYEGSSTGPVGNEEGMSQVRAQTRADVVTAASGAIRQTLTDAGAGRIAFLSPAPDSVGGPGPDLLWDTTIAPDQAYECMYVDVVIDWVTHCEQEPAGGWGLELAMLDGATLEPAWTVTVPDGWFGFSLGDDLDADGRSDVMVIAGDFEEVTTMALSGATGQTLWDHSSTDGWIWPIVVDPIDDVAGDDLVTLAMAWGDLTGGDTALVVERRSGLTGEVLSSERHTLPSDDEGNGTFTMVYASGAGDGTGDGTGDLTFGWIRANYHYDDETGEEHLLSLTSAGQAQSGRTGETVRELDVSGELALLFPVDDLDGDRLTDLVDERFTYDEANGEDVSRWSFSPFSAVPATWSTSAAGSWVWADTAGDLDGDPGNDLLVTSHDHHSAVVSSTVRAVNGAGGAELWTLSTR